MSSRPSVEGVFTIPADFDLNAEAAATVTQGNSVDVTAVGATDGGAGNHTDSGGKEENKDADTTIGNASEDKTECLTLHPEEQRQAENPIVKVTGRGNDPETSQFVCYFLPQNDKREFKVSDLIWGKVRSHPWWPGLIVDPSFASELALKHQRRNDRHLIAYFGDKTFAWCGDSQLKPFFNFFSQMEKQSSNEGFRDAVDGSLYEVSRRVQLGMVCSCVPERLYSELKVHNIDSSGVRKGFTVEVVGKLDCLQMFQPDVFLQYITTLARSPLCHANQFDVRVAHAQLRAYNRLECHLNFQDIFTGKGSMERKDESSPFEKLVARSTLSYDYNDTLLRNSTSLKIRSRRGRKIKVKQEAPREVESISRHVRSKRESHIEDRVGSRKRTKSLAVSSTDSRNRKGKKRRLDLFGSIKVKSPSPPPQKSFVIGECISRFASKLTSLPHNLKSIGDPFQKKKDKVDPEYDGPFSLDTSIHFSDQKCSTDKSFPDENMSMKELLSQFVSVASDPLRRVPDSCRIAVSFFCNVRLMWDSSSNVPVEFWTHYLETCVSGSAEGMEPQKGMKRKRGRPPKLVTKADNSVPKVELQNSEIKHKRGRATKYGPAKNKKNTLEGINSVQTVKRKRGRPSKLSYGEDVKQHEEEWGKTGRVIDKKQPFEVVDNKNNQVEMVPTFDSSEKLTPDYLNDSYWTDVVVQNSPKKRRRGRKRQEESLITSTDSSLKPDSEPPVSRSSTAISDTQIHHIASVIHSRNNASVYKGITYFGEKSVEECNPTALVLNFSATYSLPSEIDLVRIFSHYGPLKESNTELQKNLRREIVVFKRCTDAEIAFKEVPFSRFGPALVDFCLKKFPLQPDNTQKLIAVDAKGTVPVDGENFEDTGSKNELFNGVPSLPEVPNPKRGETFSNSSMVDNLKHKLPSPMNTCKPEILAAERGDLPFHTFNVPPNLTGTTVSDRSNFQTVYSGKCQSSMNMLLSEAQDRERDGDRGQAKPGNVEPSENEMSVSHGNVLISCHPERSPHQGFMTCNTFQIVSAGHDNDETVDEESSMKVGMIHVPERNSGSTQCDERGCCLLHPTNVKNTIEFCSSEKAVLSGDLCEMDDPSTKSKGPNCGANPESFIYNKNEATLDSCVTVSEKGSTPAHTCQSGDQEESFVVGSSLYDSGNMNLISVEVRNFEDTEKEINTALDNSRDCHRKLHAAADCIFQALDSAEEPTAAESVCTGQGQKTCKVLAFDGEMEVTAPRRDETNSHVSGNDVVDISDLHPSLTSNEAVSDGGNEQSAQNIRSSYTLGTAVENSVGVASDITDLRLPIQLASFMDRKNCQ